MIGALDQPSVNMDEKETSTTSPLKEQDESRHNQLLESTRYQEQNYLKKTITEHLTSELVLMKEESDALKQLEESTEEKINLFDETDEDVNIPLENVFQKVKVIFFLPLPNITVLKFPFRGTLRYLTSLGKIK